MGRFVVLGMENAVAGHYRHGGINRRCEVPGSPPGGNAGLHQAGPRAGEVLSAGALFFRPQMAGGNRHQVDNYRVCCTIGVDSDPGGLVPAISVTSQDSQTLITKPTSRARSRYRKRSRWYSPRITRGRNWRSCGSVPFKPAPPASHRFSAAAIAPGRSGRWGSQCWQYWPAFAPQYYRHCRAYPPRPRLFFKQERYWQLAALHQFIKGVNPRRPHATMAILFMILSLPVGRCGIGDASLMNLVLILVRKLPNRWGNTRNLKQISMLINFYRLS